MIRVNVGGVNYFAIFERGTEVSGLRYTGQNPRWPKGVVGMKLSTRWKPSVLTTTCSVYKGTRPTDSDIELVASHKVVQHVDDAPNQKLANAYALRGVLGKLSVELREVLANAYFSGKRQATAVTA